jgi:hypothetical protein
MYSTIKVRQRNISLCQIFQSTLAQIKDDDDDDFTGVEQQEGGKIVEN